MLFNNKDIVSEIDNQKISEPSDSIGKNIFPFLYVPDETTEAMTYICFEMFTIRNLGSTMLRDELHFYIFSHQDHMLDKYSYTRVDVLQSLIAKQLNGSGKFGIGDLELQRSTAFDVDLHHRGKELIFSVVAQNQGGDQINGQSTNWKR